MSAGYGQELGHATRGDDDIGSRELLLFPIGFVNSHSLGIDKSSLALDKCDARRLHEHSYTLTQLFDHTVLACHKGSDIGCCVIIACGKHFVVNFGRMTKTLRGDAPCIEAGSAQRSLFDDDGLQARLGCLDCCLVASGACSDYDKIDFIHKYRTKIYVSYFPFLHELPRIDMNYICQVLLVTLLNNSR